MILKDKEDISRILDVIENWWESHVIRNFYKTLLLLEEISLHFDQGMTVLDRRNWGRKVYHYRCYEYDAG